MARPTGPDGPQPVSRRAALAAAGAVMAGAAGAAPAGSVFDFTPQAIEGGPLPLAQYRGRPMLVVNTASFCGFTPQYAGLQRLHERFGPRGLVVLGVPSQDFNQESADNGKVKAFCEANYNVEFPMTVVSPIRGPQAMPLFAFLAERGGGPPRWNFHKYLVARDGRTVRGFPTAIGPESREVIQAIEAALAAPAPAA
ncbi:glutathione peroxidase [Paracraurococcus ruber]|uniref:Glutathione peroxidase n=2 Tax=Paracraurococcus ruber TaxID=77675 RepID=A0ABS1D6A3_9PROT|nr:hypothetical protein [Paracraurococcus ruber]TDG13079.1 glutathione peroxidase [Paracraurococcus ruber]